MLKRISQSHANFLLLLSSFCFYGYWDIRFLPLLLGSIIINYLIGRRLTKETKLKKSLLGIGIILNFLPLAYFKYSGFILENLNQIFDGGMSISQTVLPLAISFFTFQQIAYLVDAAKGESSEPELLNYALFVSFFPQLIAGPIVHHKEMMPQFKKNVQLSSFHAKGIFLFVLGLSKKVLLADSFAPIVHAVFESANPASSEIWIGSLSYSLQLYFDFSGYTDMAWGAAFLFGIQLPQNFNSPYKASSIREFWRRWHMTLSRFLRDYLYIPLGGNRRGYPRELLNLLITFLLGGLWHGAAWTFVIWGAIHGASLIVERIWIRYFKALPSPISYVLTLAVVFIGWIFFRAKSFDQAVYFLDGLIGNKNLPTLNLQNVQTLALLGIGMALAAIGPNSNQLTEGFKPTLRSLVIICILFIVSLLQMTEISEFLYYQF